MATVKAFVKESTSKRRKKPTVPVHFRLCDGRAKQIFHTSEIGCPLNAEILSGIGINNSEPHDPEEALSNSYDFWDEDEQTLRSEKNWDHLLDQIKK